MKIKYLISSDVKQHHLRTVSSFRNALYDYLLAGEEEFVYDYKNQGRRGNKAALRIKIDGPTAQKLFDHIKWLDMFQHVQARITERYLGYQRLHNKRWKGTKPREKDTDIGGHYIKPETLDGKRKAALRKWRSLKVDPIR